MSDVPGARIDGSAPTAALQAELAALVCKRGVGLGGLSQPQRLLALAVPAGCIPAGAELSERQVNAALIRGLQAEAGFLDIDHVELRRWLVDTGWWSRDGYGHAYRRVTGEALPEPLAAIDTALADLGDLATWVAACTTAFEARRRERRAAWRPEQGNPRHG